jgi:hypothetical protein
MSTSMKPMTTSLGFFEGYDYLSKMIAYAPL